MWNIGIVGASGYAGGELMRFLARHPRAKIRAIASRSHVGKPLSEVFPSLSLPDLPLKFVNTTDMDDCDLVFLAVPHGVAHNLVEPLLKNGQKVIDIGADFRIKDLDIYTKWYGIEHKAPQYMSEAVYGLPEIHRKDIKNTSLVGNPGCYPTSAILGLAPLMKAGLADLDTIVIDSLSGVSGAGRGGGALYHFPHAADNCLAYGVGTHRHVPEIEQELSALAGEELKITFTPHLVPAVRGILSTITLKLKDVSSTEQLTKLYEEFYKDEYFIRVLTKDRLPQTKNVLGSNFCELGVRFDPRVNRAVVVAAIDNLAKGAASQAIQNMNIMADWDEKLGIDQPAMYP